MDELDELRIELKTLDTSLKSTPNKVELLYKRAELNRRLAISLNNIDLAYKALKDNDRAIGLKPSDPIAWLERGLTYYTLNKQDEAISDFSRSLSLEESSQAYYNRAVSKWNKWQADYEAAMIGNTDSEHLINEALEDYAMALKIEPFLVDAYYNRGVIFISLGKYTQALPEFSKCLEIDSSDYLVCFNRAICFEHNDMPRYSDKKALQKAIEDYGQVIKLNPDYLPALYNRATCYEMMSEKGRYADKQQLVLAIKDYDTILHKEPHNLSAMYNRGWALEHLGKLNEAIEDYQRFIQLSQDGFTVGQLSVHLKQLLGQSC